MNRKRYRNEDNEKEKVKILLKKITRALFHCTSYTNVAISQTYYIHYKTYYNKSITYLYTNYMSLNSDTRYKSSSRVSSFDW